MINAITAITIPAAAIPLLLDPLRKPRSEDMTARGSRTTQMHIIPTSDATKPSIVSTSKNPKGFFGSAGLGADIGGGGGMIGTG